MTFLLYNTLRDNRLPEAKMKSSGMIQQSTRVVKLPSMTAKPFWMFQHLKGTVSSSTKGKPVKMLSRY